MTKSRNFAAGIDRPDLTLIAEMVAPGTRVLDVGCGDGLLLELLSREKDVDGRGVEISQEGVSACVSRGLSVIQGNAETDLYHYPDGAFDYVILSLTLPALYQPREILLELLRVGRRAIVCTYCSVAEFRIWARAPPNGSTRPIYIPAPFAIL